VFCAKWAQPDDLAVAVRQAFEHSIYFATNGEHGGASTSETTSPEDSAVSLTKREIEILRLAAEGHSNSQLARMLWVTEQTVKFHLSNIYRKLDVSNRTEASRWAQRHGMLSHQPAAAA
jgi:DNA-binding NarL/FixJ family response regulator